MVLLKGPGGVRFLVRGVPLYRGISKEKNPHPFPKNGLWVLQKGSLQGHRIVPLCAHVFNISDTTNSPEFTVREPATSPLIRQDHHPHHLCIKPPHQRLCPQPIPQTHSKRDRIVAPALQP